MPEFDYMSALSVDGQIRSSAQGKVLGSFAVMPAASALSENAIVLYTGTTGTYVSGQFYMCVNTGSGYEWQPVTISGTEEDTYTADRALVTNSLGQVTASGITAEELGYLSGATSPLQAQINGKVTAVSGMGLSQNSYTTGEKNKLAGIAAGAQVNVIEAVQRNGSAVPVSGKTVNISVPVALSELTNDKGFIDSTVENLANFYTKAEVNSLVSTIPKFAVQVVSALPASGQSATTIYLAPNSGSSGNVYDEYLWVNNAWEKIGSTQVSFTLDQDGNSIVINGTTLKDASSTSAGLMSITSYNDLQTAKSNISSLQNSYSTLNGTVSTLGTTVSGLSSRLTTAESTLSTTVSRVSTCESNNITGGSYSNNTLSLTKQGGGSVDIPFEGLTSPDNMIAILQNGGDEDWYRFTIEVTPTDRSGYYTGWISGTSFLTIPGYSIGELYSFLIPNSESSSKRLTRDFSISSSSRYSGYWFNTSDIQTAIIDALQGTDLDSWEKGVHIESTQALNLRFKTYFGSGITNSSMYVHFNVHTNTSQIIQSVDNFSFTNTSGASISTIANHDTANRIWGLITSISFG